MTVIAMTREMGTRGKDVAADVAEKLGLEVVHHELVERHLAERLKINEAVVHRFLEGEASLWDRWKIDNRRVSQYTSEEVLDLALKGNVIIRGWGAAQLMRDVPHVLCVRVCAPMTFRITEMKARLGVDKDSHVRREIERSDEGHDRAVRAIFQINWRNPSSYNVALNTGRMSVALASEILQQLARAPEFQATDQSRAKLRDKLILARVRSMLDETGKGALMGGGLQMEVADGVVTISGIATNDLSLGDTMDAIRGVDGVIDVKNDVQLVAFAYGP